MNSGDQNLIDHWFISKNISEGTQKNYSIALLEFAELNQKTISQLKEEAIKEQLEGIWITDRSIQHFFNKYKKYLKDKNLAPNTQNLRMSAVRSFYFSFQIQLPDYQKEKGDISLEKNYGRLISKEEIYKMANAASLRERALIYLMALSGMSQKEARELTIRKLIESSSETLKRELYTIFDLFDAEEELKKEVITLHIIRKKAHYKYITFIPPESTIHIIDYLRERVYGRNPDIRVKTIDEPIFVKIDGTPMDSDLVGKNIKRAGIDAGFKKQKGSYSFWRPHSLRKYFITTIIKNLRDHELADFLAGHTISPVKRAYWYINTEELKEDYFEALTYLSIDEIKVKEIQSEGYKEWKEDSVAKDRALKRKQNEIQILEERLNDLVNVVEQYMKKPQSPLMSIFQDEEIVEELIKIPKVKQALEKALQTT